MDLAAMAIFPINSVLPLLWPVMSFLGMVSGHRGIRQAAQELRSLNITFWSGFIGLEFVKKEITWAVEIGNGIGGPVATFVNRIDGPNGLINMFPIIDAHIQGNDLDVQTSAQPVKPAVFVPSFRQSIMNKVTSTLGIVNAIATPFMATPAQAQEFPIAPMVGAVQQTILSAVGVDDPAELMALPGGGAVGEEIAVLEDAGAMAAGGISDSALVVRGGQNLPQNFLTGSGVSVSESGILDGVSVQSAHGVDLETLSQSIPHNQVGVTTVGDIRSAGGNVIPSPTPYNPYHSILSGIDADTASGLFRPTIPNPAKP